MNNQQKTARIAGFLYLITVVTGMFSLGYEPSTLVVRENAAATFQNISSASQLFRLSIASSMLCYIAFLLLPLALYKLLHNVNVMHARLMVILAITSVPVSFINLQHKLSVLTLTGKSNYLSAFNLPQLQSQVMLQLNAYNAGISVVQVFWGLWLFPFGYLVYKSGLLPKVLGIFLMLGCIGYVISAFGKIIFADFYQFAGADYITLPASVGEIGTCLWLLIFGVKKKNKNG